MGKINNDTRERKGTIEKIARTNGKRKDKHVHYTIAEMCALKR